MLSTKLSVYVLLAILPLTVSAAPANLRVGFYKKACPNAEFLVRAVVRNHLNIDKTLAPSILRMHFHDSFVRGTDASVLLNSTSTNQAEKDSIPNLSLRGFEVIDDAKAAVEAVCPGIVSCADVLALAARDAVRETRGPFWNVECGRRDGTESHAAEVLQNLPAPFFNASQLISNFQSKGLNTRDLVLLSGGHTIGFSHCSTIETRLYNFTGKGDTDPALDAGYAQQLKQICKPGDTITKIPMDPFTVLNFDRGYFVAVVQHKGLFQSDEALLDPSVLQGTHLKRFFVPFGQGFARSMVKMGRIGVLTGSQGQIRKVCSVVNST